MFQLIFLYGNSLQRKVEKKFMFISTEPCQSLSVLIMEQFTLTLSEGKSFF